MSMLTDCVYLDTETSGLYDDAVVLELGIVDRAGNVLFENFIKPTDETIFEGDYAQHIHGITQEMIMDDGVYMEEAREEIDAILRGENVVIYNANYDVRLMEQTGYDVREAAKRVYCSMIAYSDFSKYRRWHSYFGNYTWRKLIHAYVECGGGKDDHIDHRATGDCQKSRVVWLQMVKSIGTYQTFDRASYIGLVDFVKTVQSYGPDLVRQGHPKRLVPRISADDEESPAFPKWSSDSEDVPF